MNWRKMDSAPKDGTAFLGYWPKFAGFVADKRFQPTHWNGARWVCQLSDTDSPTHWIKLPEKPDA